DWRERIPVKREVEHEPPTPLDDEHKRVMDWITQRYGSCSYWDGDHGIFATHTYILKLAHKELGLRGEYDTVANGTELGDDQNCRMYPKPGGAWHVQRYHTDSEHELWWTGGPLKEAWILFNPSPREEKKPGKPSQASRLMDLAKDVEL